ncbi:ras guanine nucleotide exchange factor domain-containing protein [Phakopsora pachyrhizi]|uniref:Ras guanine nucleotide exchange factor domain-containing protein n=1 Tax=Phakopsora pachyrhizi TaxID=170000 RepID=A0AAV0AW70_PHAPC|nr:ras guanine nucleotide exchange factor domain-containing protein [Phakopsora pachyrhizi]CAH7674344.1 ras guanine nucleotide exchange factor domain-containing protein [Phakopsora pachyrhizi]
MFFLFFLQHSGDWAGHTIRHENDSEEAAKLRQPLYSELNKPETAAILEPKIHSHSQWRISNPSISLEDELAEDEVETGIPWRNRENFTHELKSGHSRDRYLTAEEAEVEEGGSDDEEDNISEKIPSDSLESVGDISTRSEPRSHLRSSGSADSPLQIGKCLEPSDTSQKIQARSAGSAAAPLDPLVMASKSVTEPLREQKTTEENSSSSQEAIFSGEKDFLEDAPRTAPLRLTPNTQHLQSFSSSSKFSTELESPRNRSLSDTLIRRTRTRRLEELDSCKNSVQYSDSQTIQKIDVDRFKHGFLDAKSEIEESGLDSNDAHSEDECFLDTPSSREALHVKADFKIGIAGPKGVGKSTIINRALRRPLASSSTVLYEDRNQNRITSYVSSVTNSATGKTKTLQVLEIDQMILSEKFMKKNDKEGLSWPKRLPPLDGMLLCYDAMDPNALDHLRPLLHSFWTRGGISLIVLACKSDKNEEMNATSPLKAAELVNVYGTGMIQLDGGVEDVGKKMRNSFNWIMKAIKEARGEPRSYSSASTSFVGSCYGEDLAHSRPSSIVATNFNGQSETLSNRVQADDLGNWDSASDPLTSTQPVEGTKKNPTIPEDFAPSPEGDGLRPIPILNRHAARKAIVMSQRGSDMDLHLDKTEIIDKFVFATVSGNEPSFVDQFIIIFRRFATPLDVLGALISRFEFVSAHLENDPLLTRYAHMKFTTTINSDYTPASANSSPVISVHAQNKLASGDGPGSGTTESFSLGLSLSHKGTRVSSLNTDQKAEYKLLQDFAQQLMGNTEDMIALQITRLEWDIFAEMKPRHLIRYVLAPRDPKNPRVALRDPNSPIARSTDFLNHLAVWASSMILIQEKLKNRARMLLKLMKVAYELRDMDDFHSLMGVLAGIEAQPVYRLEATFEVVQQMDSQAYRRYLSLKKLMSSQKSFSAYRLARQTASAQCVPYLGTYLQDITAINEVKEDMKDGKVNLTKFLQISKAAATVLQCEKLAPEIQIDENLENLITKAPVLNEDAQYELSYKYKPRAIPYHLQHQNNAHSSSSQLQQSQQSGVSGIGNNKAPIGTSQVVKGTRRLKQLIHTAINN